MLRMWFGSWPYGVKESTRAAEGDRLILNDSTNGRMKQRLTDSRSDKYLTSLNLSAYSENMYTTKGISFCKKPLLGTLFLTDFFVRGLHYSTKTVCILHWFVLEEWNSHSALRRHSWETTTQSFAKDNLNRESTMMIKVCIQLLVFPLLLDVWFSLLHKSCLYTADRW